MMSEWGEDDDMRRGALPLSEINDLAREKSEGEVAGVVAIVEAWKINQHDAKLLGRTNLCSWNLDHRFCASLVESS
jgi:hypothetical protein